MLNCLKYVCLFCHIFVISCLCVLLTRTNAMKFYNLSWLNIQRISEQKKNICVCFVKKMKMIHTKKYNQNNNKHVSIKPQLVPSSFKSNKKVHKKNVVFIPIYSEKSLSTNKYGHTLYFLVVITASHHRVNCTNLELHLNGQNTLQQYEQA